ncbi:amidohydrolase [Antrihabitans stalactiti]|uniref:Amidohydrolase n=1 Tax=Antrihabitans stalactiti TaxID=2584121 RepID=A0A848KHV2_9NOCA|nr:amidohydrolase [Antrihabitans stalactiti]NMN98315.1 amidohydrolase [Antrihabitans stalactiti]
MKPELGADLAQRLAELYMEVHSDPELSMQEHATARLVVAALAGTGCEITENVGGTGVVAVLDNGPGPVVMLRADMDALPVAEQTGLPYASTKTAIDPSGNTVPVMHACGHDMHVTCLVGALHLLSDAREQWSGTVLGVFQPGEETCEGAKAMLADGIFDRFPKPSIILGQHVAPLPSGMIGHGSGPVMAAADYVWVTLHGRGAHGSMPERSVDPVLMAAATVMRLEAIISREVASREQAVVTVGVVQAGNAPNVIPESARLGISCRTYSHEVRDTVRAAVERIIRAEALASNAPKDPEFDWYVQAPVTVNDPAATVKTIGAFEAHFGADRVRPIPPASGSEDVAEFGNAIEVPLVFWFWGGTDPKVFADDVSLGVSPPSNHSAYFAPVIEPTITTGVEALTVAALTWLGSPTT